MYFNSQPHKEADHIKAVVIALWSHFNSQPHKEADFLLLFVIFFLRISTHSLTRRLTERAGKITASIHISTHSLTRRLTNCSCHEEPVFPFQLTASVTSGISSS